MTRMLVIRCELYSSKNSREIHWKRGKPFVDKSDAVKRGEKILITLLGDYKLRKQWREMTRGLGYPLRVCFRIYRRTKGRFDYTNIVQSLQDCMKRCGYLPDDDANHLIPQFEPYAVDPINPRVELTIADCQTRI